ncbi:3-oxoacyl-ACP reductase FabG [Oceanobacillus longus]|uniref:3-oxoacyl-ACP reductase FabG n=1 Tax=Oceanobacillus longus TaxID=930120 RepID=A0ABV8GZ99_9BACI
MSFKDKVVVITGAGNGIGKLAAQKFAENGAIVVLSDINGDNAEQSATEINENGGQAMAIKADVSNENDIDNMVSKVIDKYKTIDILINNAGFTRDFLIGKMTIDDWDAVINTSLKGCFLTTKYASPYMIENKAGKIINISSRAYLGNPGQANYSSAKAGIIGFTKAMAKELGRYSINVNCIAPGLTETAALKEHEKYEMIKERALKETPLRRLGQAEDVVNVMMFLASDQSSYITGDVLHVTGGRFG